MIKMNKKNIVRAKVIQFAIGIVIFLGLIMFTGPQKILGALKDASILLILLSGLIMIVDFASESIKLYVNFLALRVHINFLKLVKGVLLSRPIGILTPGGIGNIIIVFYLRKEKIRKEKIVNAFLLERVILFTLYSFASIVGFLYFSESGYTIIIATITIISLTTFLLVMRYIDFSKIKIMKKILDKFNISEQKLKNVFFYVLKKKKRYLLLAFLVSFIDFVTFCTVYYFLILAFGINVNFLGLMFVIPLASLISIIPITGSSLGLREVSAAILLTQFLEVPLSISTNVMIIQRLLEYTIMLIIYLAGSRKILDYKHKEEVIQN